MPLRLEMVFAFQKEVREGYKERTQVFSGIVISRKGAVYMKPSLCAACHLAKVLSEPSS